MTANELRAVLKAERQQLVSLREISIACNKHVSQVRTDAKLHGFPEPVLNVGVVHLYLSEEIADWYNARVDVRRGPKPHANDAEAQGRTEALAARLTG